ncbi:MAG TPA: GYF domain-containing protein [Xanthomonadales bacterium]|nr:GYF domain-containing protein [Xanthomonadales bacterium]
MNEAWYYADTRNQQQGPVDAARLRDAYARGEVGEATLVWHAGLANWEPLARHAAALGIAVRGSAPPPAAAPRAGVVVKPSKGTSGWVIAIAVVFIGIMFLGVIAAIAIPAYSDYTERAKVIEAINVASSLKLQVEEFHATEARCPTNGEGGILEPESYATELATGIHVGPLESGECAIQVLFVSVAGAEPGREVLFTRSDTGTWTTTSNLPNRALPARLRR